MNLKEALQQQSAFRQFAQIDHWNAPHALTLTMKQGRQVHSGRFPVHVSLNAQEASTNMRHFTNRLNKAVYGNAASRYAKRVPIIAVQEGGNDLRLHYHAWIDCPRDDLISTFPALVTELWGQTPWGYREIDINASTDVRWTNYISKLSTKSNVADAIDWENCYNPRLLS